MVGVVELSSGESVQEGNIKVKTNENVLILIVSRARLNVSKFIFGNKFLLCVRRSFCADTNESKGELVEDSLFCLC